MRSPRILDEFLASIVRREREAKRAAEADTASSHTRLHALERGRLTDFVRLLADHWRDRNAAPAHASRSVDDPVYGRVFLEESLATVLSHPMLQRLNHIKQLSFSYPQFPSSTHTRLSHSLGAARNAELAIGGILDRGVYYVVGDAEPRRFDDAILRQRPHWLQRAKLTALLHDLGHGPFGHAMDNYVSYLRAGSTHPMPDKKFTAVYIKEYLVATLEQLGFVADEVIALLSRKRVGLSGIDNLIADVIDSSLDVDRMDYLVRDAHMTGLSMGHTNTLALIDSMRAVRDNDTFVLAYDGSVIRYMEHFLVARDSMFVNCYEHFRKKAAERMFTKLVKSLVEDTALGLTIEDIYVLTDEEVLTILSAAGCGSERRRSLLNELLTDLDYIVVHEVALRRKEGDAPLSAQVQTWLTGMLTHQQPQLKTAYIDQPTNWEEAIAAESIGADRSWQIQVVLPAHEVYSPHYNAARLLVRENGRYRTSEFFDSSSAVQSMLESMNIQRQRIRVMCPGYLPSHEQESIDAASLKILARISHHRRGGVQPVIFRSEVSPGGPLRVAVLPLFGS